MRETWPNWDSSLETSNNSILLAIQHHTSQTTVCDSRKCHSDYHAHLDTMPHYTVPIETQSSRNSPKPPPTRVYNVSEPPYRGQLEPDTSAYRNSSHDTAIVIDNGSSSVRAGWQSDASPRLQFPPLMSNTSFNASFLWSMSNVS